MLQIQAKRARWRADANYREHVKEIARLYVNLHQEPCEIVSELCKVPLHITPYMPREVFVEDIENS